MHRMRIRSALIRDAEGVANLVNTAFGPERFFTEEDRTSPDKVRALLETGKFLLLEDWDSLVGCVYVELRGERGYFGLLSVEPGRQRSGLGSRLIGAAEDYCRSAGCRLMDLTLVNLRTELPAMYRRLGYRENGTEPFPAESKLPCHLVRMTKPLRGPSGPG
jgi:GNAT superfamily N-acetyltransferase